MSSPDRLAATILIAVMNGERTIEKAVISALSQTVKDIEVIVVDDGSSDSTSEILKRLESEDPRIKLVSHARNLGVSAARNTGLDLAQGEWVAILDADDSFELNRLERVMIAGESEDIDIVIDNLTLVEEGTGKREVAFPEEWFDNDCLDIERLLVYDTPGKHNYRPIGFSKPVIRRSVIEASSLSYNTRFWLAEDFLFLAELLINGARARLINEPLYNYSVGSTSSVSSKNGACQNILVNDEIRRKVAIGVLEQSARRRLLGQLKDRKEAFKVQEVINTFKEAALLSALLPLLSVSPGYVFRRVLGAAMRRI